MLIGDDVRGIVAGPSGLRVDVDANSVSYRNGPILSSDQLRFYLLYWDKIISPRNIVVGSPDTLDISYLAALGVLEQPLRPRQSGEAAAIIAESYVHEYKIRESISPGKWVMAVEGWQPLPQAHSTVDRALLFEFHDLLPRPSEDTPLADILEFKFRYRDLLLSLRHHLDDLYLEVQDSGDFDLARNRAIRNLAEDLSRLDASIRNNFGRVVRETLRGAVSAAEIDLAAAGIRYAAGAPLVAEPYTLAAYGAVAVVKLCRGMLLKGGRATAGPLAYAHMASHALR